MAIEEKYGADLTRRQHRINNSFSSIALFFFLKKSDILIKPPNHTIFFTRGSEDLNIDLQYSLQKILAIRKGINKHIVVSMHVFLFNILIGAFVYVKFILLYAFRMVITNRHTEEFLRLISLQHSDRDTSSIQLSQTSKE